MSETPRTDALDMDCATRSDLERMVDLCRELERETAVRKTAIANLHSVIDEMRKENSFLRRQLESLRPDAEKYRSLTSYSAYEVGE